MIGYEVLSPADAADFEWMTFPAYRHLLGLEPSPRHQHELDRRIIQPVAVAARVGAEPAGLVVAELPFHDEDPNGPEVLSLFVNSDFRNQGIGTGLMAELQRVIASRGFGVLNAVYMTGRPDIDFVERILRRLEWQPPTTRMISVRFDLKRLLEDADWLR